MTSKWSIIFFVATIAATLYSSNAQRTHVVGDTLGWTIPPGGAITYTTWASLQTFTQGDILVFNFITGIHTVAEVSKTSFDACNTASPISITTNGPANITLNSTGQHYYICTFQGHCTTGMKLAINVSSPSNTTTTTPPPQSTPSSPAPVPSPSRTPPPQSTPSSSAPAPSPSRSSVTYVVGDTFGWTFPSGNLTSYAAWATNKTFAVGDTLVFNFVNGRHNVAELTSKADFDNCNTSATSNPITNSPATVTLTTPGEHFYICTFPTHCASGMKLAVNVSSSATNAPPTSSGSSAPPPPTTSGFVPSPPPPSSASKFVVASAMPITLLSIAFALFY